MNIEEMQERQDEELHKALKPWLQDGLLRHPLVYGVPYTPAMNWNYNDTYVRKTEELLEFRKKKDWHTVIFLHERPYRFEALEDLVVNDLVTVKEFWPLFNEVWCDSENLYQNLELLDGWLAFPVGSELFTTEEDRPALDALPDEITVFRGWVQDRGEEMGYSWTTDQAKAEWFAVRLMQDGEHGVVTVGRVHKDKIVGVIMRRDESEVVADPRHVKKLRSYEAPKEG